MASAAAEAAAAAAIAKIVKEVAEQLGEKLVGEIGYLLGNCCYDLTQKDRPLCIVIINKTSEKITQKKVLFDSGRFWKDTAEFPASSTTVLFMANSDGSILSGVTGEMQFTSPSHEFSLGFSNPYTGCYKGLVLMGKQNDWAAYNQMENNVAQAEKFFATTWNTTKKPAVYGVCLRGW